MTLELFSNNVLEPWLYGSSTGLSPVAILVAAVFWTTLWGPAGLLLSTPLTVCLVVLGRHVPQLGFFHVLLGDEPALAPELKFYQRLLARDPEEATELAEEYLEDESLDKLYDAVIMPALGLAEQDRLRGSLDRATVQGIAEDTIGVIEELAAEQERPPDEAAAASGQAAILCIGARNGLDEAAAAMLAHLLRQGGLGATTLARDAVAGRNLARLERQGVALICLSYVNPAATQHAHRLTRRLRQHFGPEVRIMVGLWTATPAAEGREELLRAVGADLLATSLGQAVRQIAEAAEPARSPRCRRRHELKDRCRSGDQRLAYCLLPNRTSRRLLVHLVDRRRRSASTSIPRCTAGRAAIRSNQRTKFGKSARSTPWRSGKPRARARSRCRRSCSRRPRVGALAQPAVDARRRGALASLGSGRARTRSSPARTARK